jgi:hypothetical protein
VVENEPDPERAQWLERLAATEIAIARLRDLDDPAHMTLLSDLQALRDRLADDLGR